MPYIPQQDLEGIQVTMMNGDVHTIQKINSNTECKECGRVAFLVDGFCSTTCETQQEYIKPRQQIKEAL